MEARLGVARCVDLDHATHLASVFGGNASSVDSDRVEVVGVDFGAKAGRAVVGQRNAVDDKLSLIFRAARMEDGVAFIKPAGLRVDEVGEGTARKGCGTIGYRFRVEVIDGGGAFGID